MPSARPSRRRLVAAATAVLAVTAGIPAAAPAAFAATPALATVTTGVNESAPVPFPADAKITGAGTTGFLSQGPNDQYGDQQLRWTPYDGSAPTDFTSANAGYDTTGTDVFVRGDMSPARQFRSVTLRDLGNPGAGSVSFDLGSLFATYVKAVGPRTVLAKTKPDDLGKEQLLIVTDENGTKHSRAVTGLPGITHSFFTNAPAVDGKVIVGYAAGTFEEPTAGRAVIDLETGAVVETYPAATVGYLSSALALSATHVAWMDSDPSGTAVVTVNRATKKASRIAVNAASASDGYHLGLVKNWLVYGVPSKLTEPGKFPDTQLTALNLAAGELEPGDPVPVNDPVQLTDYASSTAAAADGTLLVRGGTVAKGEGLYRVSPGTSQEPTVELVATTNQPTALTYLDAQVPATIDLDSTRQIDLKWQLSRGNADVTVTLTHQRTGRTYTRKLAVAPGTAGTFGMRWAGVFDAPVGEAAKSAYNGDYTWSLQAKPQNGIGPDVAKSGSFKVTRTVKSHDFDDNGSPDLFTRDGAGVLRRIDTAYDPGTKRLLAAGQPVVVGTGWQVYDRIESVDNVAGTSAPDVLAREKNGNLWLYQGKGDGGFATRAKIGTGWQVYTHIAGGSDLTNDGKSDILATDTTGGLWLYPGTGNVNTPLGARKKIGTGWGIYNYIGATGNIGGTAAGDLIATDTTGALWLYPGKGDGTFAARTKIGTGWQSQGELVPLGDATQDGLNDLFTFRSGFYAGTGNLNAPLAPNTGTEVLNNTGVNTIVF
ncbi:FG-GAP repeat domain-containing protein [Streptomyces sp. NPDC056361]|uniref:FG-GAP repeat domain-containing protein n=1 Tax=Streptomyces sp. NPDC056361 TaxID=3345795 RepID=UPI0035D7111D